MLQENRTSFCVLGHVVRFPCSFPSLRVSTQMSVDVRYRVLCISMRFCVFLICFLQISVVAGSQSETPAAHVNFIVFIRALNRFGFVKELELFNREVRTIISCPLEFFFS